MKKSTADPIVSGLITDLSVTRNRLCSRKIREGCKADRGELKLGGHSDRLPAGRCTNVTQTYMFCCCLMVGWSRGCRNRGATLFGEVTRLTTAHNGSVHAKRTASLNIILEECGTLLLWRVQF